MRRPGCFGTMLALAALMSCQLQPAVQAGKAEAQTLGAEILRDRRGLDSAKPMQAEFVAAEAEASAWSANTTKTLSLRGDACHAQHRDNVPQQPRK